MPVVVVDTPMGPLWARGGEALEALSFDAPTAIDNVTHDDTQLLIAVREQLRAYFAGELTVFTLPLAAIGTPFQHAVWDALTRIPHGTTTTYSAIAQALHNPGAVRAVGAANGQNPIAIVVPCHRVIGADGTLTGYAGGLDRKRALLALEAGVAARSRGALL
jgi:methylated-DNA-[protein]-cysteine S-methyltransferase